MKTKKRAKRSAERLLDTKGRVTRGPRGEGVVDESALPPTRPGKTRTVQSGVGGVSLHTDNPVSAAARAQGEAMAKGMKRTGPQKKAATPTLDELLDGAVAYMRKSIGANLRKARESRGFSLDEMARRLAMTAEGVDAAENGDMAPVEASWRERLGSWRPNAARERDRPGRVKAEPSEDEIQAEKSADIAMAVEWHVKRTLTQCRLPLDWKPGDPVADQAVNAPVWPSHPLPVVRQAAADQRYKPPMECPCGIGGCVPFRIGRKRRDDRIGFECDGCSRIFIDGRWIQTREMTPDSELQDWLEAAVSGAELPQTEVDPAQVIAHRALLRLGELASAIGRPFTLTCTGQWSVKLGDEDVFTSERGQNLARMLSAAVVQLTDRAQMLASETRARSGELEAVLGSAKP